MFCYNGKVYFKDKKTGFYFTSHGIEPVSYTHLDVYKRQNTYNLLKPNFEI